LNVDAAMTQSLHCCDSKERPLNYKPIKLSMD